METNTYTGEVPPETYMPLGRPDPTARRPRDRSRDPFDQRGDRMVAKWFVKAGHDWVTLPGERTYVCVGFYGVDPDP